MIRYRLGGRAARGRAAANAGLAAAAALAPVALAAMFVSKLGWSPPPAVEWVCGGLVVLVAARAVVAFRTGARRLQTLAVVVTDDEVRVEAPSEGYAIARERVARIEEVEGPLGGLRIEAAAAGAADRARRFVHVPRGGDAFGEVRAHLERWRPIDRRGRSGPAARVGVGAFIVGAIFFVPFLFDDFVARSKVVAACVILAMWLVMRSTLRG